MRDCNEAVESYSALCSDIDVDFIRRKFLKLLERFCF